MLFVVKEAIESRGGTVGLVLNQIEAISLAADLLRAVDEAKDHQESCPLSVISEGNNGTIEILVKSK